jgi:hypothetical protein
MFNGVGKGATQVGIPAQGAPKAARTRDNAMCPLVTSQRLVLVTLAEQCMYDNKQVVSIMQALLPSRPFSVLSAQALPKRFMPCSHCSYMPQALLKTLQMQNLAWKNDEQYIPG